MIYKTTQSFDGAGGAQIIDISNKGILTEFGELIASRHQFDASGPSSGTLDIEYEPIGQTDVWRPIDSSQIAFADPVGIQFDVVAQRFRVTPTSVTGTYTVTLAGLSER